MRFSRVHFVVIVALLATGCVGRSGATSSSSTERVAANPVPAETLTTAGDGISGTSDASDEAEPARVALPEISVNDRSVLMVANERLVAECMAREGFQFVPLDLATAIGIAEAREDERRADLPIDDAAEATGYIQPRVDPGRAFDNDAYANSLNDAARDAWSRAALGDFGDAITVNMPDGNQVSIPKAGCLSEARVALYGSVEDAMMFEMGIAGMRVAAMMTADADPDVVTARADWVRCMSASGWTFEHFTQARQYAYQHPDEALSVWTADRTCSRSSGLRDAFGRALQQSVEDLVDENLGLIEQYESSVDQAIDRATDLLAS